MQYVLMDLEWNGAYSKKAHGYFNEIIEIGATKLDENLQKVDSFHALLKPVVSRKITHLVTDLTGIDAEELRDGGTFTDAASALRQFVGKDAVLLTWSTTDLLVLLENCRYFFGSDRIPFMTAYVDAQAYCQPRIEEEKTGQQMGLARACELLGIADDGLEAHRAQDDSELTARVFAAVFERESFEAAVRPADEEFYKRLTYKPYIVSHAGNPLVKDEYLQFTCPECGKPLKPKGRWRFSCRMLCADMPCSCGKKYTGRVQVKVLYDDVVVRRRLTEKKPPEEPTEEKTE